MNSTDLDFCISVIRTAGTVLHTQCAERTQAPATREAAYKMFNEANTRVESLLKEALADRFPSIRWSSSEFKTDQQQQPEFEQSYWVCDAIDGAIHFLQGFGFYSLSLCLIRNGAPVLAFVYDPERDELFHAEEGKGAYMNGKPIHVAAKSVLSDAYITTSPPSFPADEPETTNKAIRSAGAVMLKSFAVKMLGSVKLQLAYVACGRLDGYWEFASNYGDYYDWLPGALIVQEAGGLVTDTEGRPFTWRANGVLAANKILHQTLAHELSGHLGAGLL